MNYFKIGMRFVFFAILLVLATVMVDFLVTKMYSFLLEYYSLPKSDSNITALSFVISLIFTGLLSYAVGYWNVLKSVE